MSSETSKRAEESDDEIKQLQSSVAELTETVATLRDELHAAHDAAGPPSTPTPSR